jgi:hypothetical protein
MLKKGIQAGLFKKYEANLFFSFRCGLLLYDPYRLGTAGISARGAAY